MLKKWLFRLKILVYLVGLVALLIAIFENTTPTSVYFLSCEVVFPLSLWLMGAFLLGSLIVLSLFLFGSIPSRWRKNKIEKPSAPIQEKKKNTQA
jgi:uncharacterized integral membrane protein